MQFLLSMEDKYSKQVKLELKVLEEAEKAAKIKNKEKLIDDLMFGEEDASKILANHREMVTQEERSRALFSSGKQFRYRRPQIIINLVYSNSLITM